MAESQSAAATVAALINKGKLDEAYEYTCRDDLSRDDLDDANYWFMAALVARLLGRMAVVAARWDTARSCANYTRQMEGDFHRDVAIALIKDGQPDEASAELHLAQSIHAGNDNREAAISMVRGRIEFIRKHYARAIYYHNAADDIWLDMSSNDEQYDFQWLLNNRYHRLRAGAVLHRPLASSDYSFVVRYSDDPRQKLGARFAYFGGRLGIRLFDRVIEPRLAR